MKPEPEAKPSFFPWLFVIGAFVLLLMAWSSMIYVAVKFSPEPIPVSLGH